MRTTVTLDPDVVRLIQEAMHKERASFKDTLNSAVRAGLKSKHGRGKKEFILKAHPLKLRAGVDEISMNRLADELESEAIAEKLRK